MLFVMPSIWQVQHTCGTYLLEGEGAIYYIVILFVSLVLLFTGIPIPDIKWFKDGNQMELDYNKYIEEDEQWSFIIPNIGRKDAGNYTCVVKNQYGTITHTCNVQVYGKFFKY